MKNSDEIMDPQVADYLKIVRSRPPVYLHSMEELRHDIDNLRNYYPPEPVKKTEDIEIPGPAGMIKARVYTPEGKAPMPLVVYYHGGGWCIGSVEGYDSICTALANRMPAVVMSVGYRLAPEHPFPAGIEDCYAALEFAAKNSAKLGADGKCMAVMGDSAGANLAAATSLKARDEKGPAIAFQVLVYPAANLTSLEIESSRRYGKGYDLDKELIEIFRSNYMPDKKDWANPYASPALADLRGLPPALLITAEFDPLRDDGRMFAEKLKKAGVPVKYSLYKGVIHGFLSFTTFAAAQKALDEIKVYFADHRDGRGTAS